MIPVPTDPIALLHAARALELYAHRVGRDRLPAEFVDLADALGTMSARGGSFGVPSVAAVLDVAHSAVMSRAEVARLVNRHESTVTRWARDGKLDKIGRGFSAASVMRLVG